MLWQEGGGGEEGGVCSAVQVVESAKQPEIEGTATCSSGISLSVCQSVSLSVGSARLPLQRLNSFGSFFLFGHG